jgi:hypothetical protein
VDTDIIGLASTRDAVKTWIYRGVAEGPSHEASQVGSCTPNAGATSIATTLVATGTHADGIAELERMPANTMVFRARRDIAGGDEINVTYITEAQLQQPAACRRNSLSHYLFWCRCERCELEDDAKAGTTSCTTATVLARN